MLGWSRGTNRPGDLRTPHLGPGRGWGRVPSQGSHHGKTTLSSLPLPPLSFLPLSVPRAPCPLSPEEAGTPGSRWDAAGDVTHLPALPAGLSEGTGAASVSLWARKKMVSEHPRQSSGVEAASCPPHHPEPPCLRWHRAGGDSPCLLPGSSRAPVPSVPAVPGGPWDLAGSWSGTGGKKKRRLSWGRTQRLRRSWEGWAPLKVGCAVTQGTHRLSHGFGWDLAPPCSISPQLPRYTGGCILGQGSTCSSSSHDPAKPCRRDKVMGGLTKKSALPSTPWMCPGGPWREEKHQHLLFNIRTMLQQR